MLRAARPAWTRRPDSKHGNGQFFRTWKRYRINHKWPAACDCPAMFRLSDFRARLAALPAAKGRKSGSQTKKWRTTPSFSEFRNSIRRTMQMTLLVGSTGNGPRTVTVFAFTTSHTHSHKHSHYDASPGLSDRLEEVPSIFTSTSLGKHG